MIIRANSVADFKKKLTAKKLKVICKCNDLEK